MKKLFLLVSLLTMVFSMNAQNNIRLDQLDLTNGKTGYGSIQKNKTVDSNPLRLKGVTYTNGIGVHAASEIAFNLFSAATRFRATVGVDDETSAKPTEGNVEFKVIGDGVTLFTSGVMQYNNDPKIIDIDVTGIAYLQLIVTLGSDNVNWSDHADWCSASFDYGGNVPVCVPTTEVPKYVRLDQISMTNATNGNGIIQINKSTALNPLKIGGVTYADGLGAHSPSEININLYGTAKRFQASVGVDDETSVKPNEANIEFQVYADNALLWTSGAMKYTDAIRKKNIDLDITGKTYLTLKSTIGSDGVNWSDHADWVATKISYFGTTPICIPKSSVILAPVIANAKYFYAKTGNPIMTRFKIKSFNPATITVTGLPTGLTYNATRNLVSGSIATPGVYTYTLKATNADGTDQATITLDVRNTLDAPTPPMGWNSWNVYGGTINETKLKGIADALVSSGMRDAGYTYLIIDDLWAAATRDGNGLLQPDATKFPSGMKALADYMHNLGIKLGIYSDAATTTCGGSLGSYGNEVKDANQFAAWGIDMLKYDYCNAPSDATSAAARYLTMSNALKNSGRKILFNICEWGSTGPEKWAAASGGHTWRNTWDSRDIWNHGAYDGGHCGVIQGLDIQNGLEYYAGPNMWNDPDMVMAGLYGTGLSSSNAGANGMTDLEYQSQFSLWCLLAAPIQTSFDVTKISAATKAILTNAEAIAIDQDILGQQATKISKSTDTDIYVKDLADGSVAVGLLNRNNTTTQNITVNWSDIYVSGTCTIRDLWSKSNVGTSTTGYTVSVAPHETKLLKIIPANATATSDVTLHNNSLNVNVLDHKLNLEYKLTNKQNLVKIDVLDITGSVVLNLEKGVKTEGKYVSSFDTTGLSAGIYICRMIAGGSQQTKKLIIQ